MNIINSTIPIYTTSQSRGFRNILRRMFHTPENPFLTRGVKKYDRSIIGGVEIETCITKGIEIDSFELYKPVDEPSITCKDGYEAIEFIADPKPLVDLLDPETDIGRETLDILRIANECEEYSCSTHVHMSMKDVCMNEYPFFDVLMRYLWVQYYQPYCVFKFYEKEHRHNNIYAQLSTETPKDGNDSRYEMFNVQPTYELPEGVFVPLPNPCWHFEFRGYGSSQGELNTEYIHLLMNLWYVTRSYYDMILKHALREGRMVKHMLITKGGLEAFNLMKLTMMLELRTLIDEKLLQTEKNMSITDMVDAIRTFDKGKNIDKFTLEDQYFKLRIVYQPPDFKIKI